MSKKYKVVTLCGSTKFREEFYEAQKKLTLNGFIVLSVGLFGHSGDNEVWEGMSEGELTETKKMLDDMHKRKIDMSDEIFVVNPGGYIGESTWSEICYSKMLGKNIESLEPISSLEIDRKVEEHIAEAEVLAWRQLDTYTKCGYYRTSNPVEFRYKGYRILDPWLRPNPVITDDCQADHCNLNEAVDPFTYYGKAKVAAFIEEIRKYR